MALYLSISKYRHNSNKFEKSCFWGSRPFRNPGLRHWHRGMPFTSPLPACLSQGLKEMAAPQCMAGIFWSPCPAMSRGVLSLAGAVQGSPVPGLALCRWVQSCDTHGSPATPPSCTGAGEGPLAPFVSSGASVHNLALVIAKLPFVCIYSILSVKNKE